VNLKKKREYHMVLEFEWDGYKANRNLKTGAAY